MIPVYLALGSNLDNPARQLQSALTELAALPLCHVEAVSSTYQSPAVGPGEQPDYLNAVLKLRTSMSAQQLLGATQAIEDNHGRQRKERWGARTLDINILLYGDEKINTNELQVPHPSINQRNFVLYPLAEIGGEQLTLPSMGVLGSLLANCPRGDLSRTPVSLTINSQSSQGATT